MYKILEQIKYDRKIRAVGSKLKLDRLSAEQISKLIDMGCIEKIVVATDDPELLGLRAKAKELDIKNTHNMKKETLLTKIAEAESKPK